MSAPAVLYLPLGGGGEPQCQSAAGARLSQLVPLMYVLPSLSSQLSVYLQVCRDDIHHL